MISGRVRYELLKKLYRQWMKHLNRFSINLSSKVGKLHFTPSHRMQIKVWKTEKLEVACTFHHKNILQRFGPQTLFIIWNICHEIFWKIIHIGFPFSGTVHLALFVLISKRREKPCSLLRVYSNRIHTIKNILFGSNKEIEYL